MTHSSEKSQKNHTITQSVLDDLTDEEVDSNIF